MGRARHAGPNGVGCVALVSGKCQEEPTSWRYLPSDGLLTWQDRFAILCCESNTPCPPVWVPQVSIEYLRTRPSLLTATIAPVVLPRHAAAGGFRVIGAEHSTSKRWIERKGRRFWIDDTVFSGRLAVTDEALFFRTLETGLGHGRAWGFGLLQIRPD